jgi:hypothetical protein
VPLRATLVGCISGSDDGRFFTSWWPRLDVRIGEVANYQNRKTVALGGTVVGLRTLPAEITELTDGQLAELG